MERFSVDVENRIVRALGAYLRATAQTDLPAAIRRYAKLAPKALMPHRDALMSALDDAGLRARIVEWLDDGKTPLKRDQRDLLRKVAVQADGWVDEVRALAGPEPRAERPAKSSEEAVDREREKTRRAREDLQRAKADAGERAKRLQSEIAERDRVIADLRRQLRDLSSDVTALAKVKGQAEAALERERRRHERDLERSAGDREKLQADTRAAKKEARELAQTVRRLERELEAARARANRKSRERPPAQQQRTPLAVPKGRMADAPETLEEWLSAPRVHLLVDGYNVTKAQGGFGDLRLESQRERLMDEIGRLARKHSAKATIVFDGADLARGAVGGSRRRSPVKVEYSKPPEIGDDHIVATLERLPQDPVVVVTNDRELQGRVAALGATVATSTQLLRLIR